LLCLLLAAGCDVDEPQRLISNLRVTQLIYQPEGHPGGTLSITAAGDMVTIDMENLPVLPAPAGENPGWVYEGWLAYEDTTLGPTTISMGRFEIAQSNTDPLFARGDGRVVYSPADGSMTASAGASALSTGLAFPDSVAFGPAVTAYVTIEPQPDDDLTQPHPTRLLMLAAGGLPGTDSTSPLLTPVDLELLSAGDLSRLVGTVTVNTVTGEFSFEFAAMGFIDRRLPGGQLDAGVIYQAWFVDDDTSPPRYRSVRRFEANRVGDVRIDAAMNPGDSDGDGVPEPLDFERVMVSIEPDGISNFQLVGQGADTSPEIFEIVPYIGVLPAPL
jgi:hypothetical protein